jgi:hypothetical protein
MRVGDAVRLTILDHCKGNDPARAPIEFYVWGRVLRLAEEYVTLAHWQETDGTVDSNTEVSVILRSAVKKVRRLK